MGATRRLLGTELHIKRGDVYEMRIYDVVHYMEGVEITNDEEARNVFNAVVVGR